MVVYLLGYHNNKNDFLFIDKNEKKMITGNNGKVTLHIIRNNDIIDNNWRVIDIARKFPPCGWEAVFKAADNELNDVSEILEEDKKTYGRFYPDCKNLFRGYFGNNHFNQVNKILTDKGQAPIDWNV